RWRVWQVVRGTAHLLSMMGRSDGGFPAKFGVFLVAPVKAAPSRKVGAARNVERRRKVARPPGLRRQAGVVYNRRGRASGDLSGRCRRCAWWAGCGAGDSPATI